MNRNKLTAIILAGGKSRRMMQDKGLVLLNGKSMIEYILKEAKMLTDKIIIITGNPAYHHFGYPCYNDLIADCGPMGGIYSALHYTTTLKNLVFSCDIPFVSSKILSTLANHTDKEEVLVPEHNGMLEPLCAIYDKCCIDKFRELIGAGKLRMIDALLEFNTKKINADSLCIENNDAFVNINTPDELLGYQSKSIEIL